MFLRSLTVRSVLFLIAIALMTTTPPAASAQTVGQATLRKMAGEGVELGIDAEMWMSVFEGTPLRAGDLVRTLYNSVAVLALPDGSTLTLEPFTTVDFREITYQRQTNALRLSVVVWAGRVQCDFSRAALGSSVSVRTPTAQVSCAGALGSVQYVRGKGTRVVVDTGRMTVTSGGGSVTLAAEQSATVLARNAAPQVTPPPPAVPPPPPAVPKPVIAKPAAPRRQPSVVTVPSTPPKLTPAPRTRPWDSPTSQPPDLAPLTAPQRPSPPQIASPPSRGAPKPVTSPRPPQGEAPLPPPASDAEARLTLTPDKIARVQKMLSNVQLLTAPDLTPEQLDAEIQSLQKSLLTHRENIALRQRLVVLYVQRGRKQDLFAAVQEFHIIARAKRLTPRGHLLFGQVLARLGLVNEAIRELRTALQWQPDLAPAHQWLAFIYTALEEYDKAYEAYEAAIALEPRSMSYRANYAEALAARGDYDAAIVQYQEAIALRDTSAHLHLRLAHIYLKKNDLDSAIAAYRAALRLQPHHEAAHEELVRLLRQTGRVQEAEEEVKRFGQAMQSGSR
ncbi:MAG: tetratricopeptide repeat protein [Abditibacteriales bacterium]|nr:tetratricopeptide repeat protein [Abditibacteriales bacterium]MDW8364331.1 tetratricopeptide repeat protein [Abditibacteriales bacterium]